MKARANSVLNPNAQIKIPCQPAASRVGCINNASTILEANRKRLGRYYELGIFLFYTGCRISEALNVRVCDLTERGDVYIRGLKGSSNRLVSVQLVADYFLKSIKRNVDPFHHMNRFTAYRLYKEIGIGKLKKGRMKLSVTHSFRDDFVRNSRSVIVDEREVSRSIGHKSTNSTGFYGKD